MKHVTSHNYLRIDIDTLRRGGQGATTEINKIGISFSTAGIIIIKNFGIPHDLILQGYQVFKEIFALPEEVKRACENLEIGRQEGYGGWNSENAKGNSESDFKEFWHLRNGTRYKRAIPQGIEVEDIIILEDLFFQLQDLSIVILEAVGEFLGRPKNHYKKWVLGGDSVLRGIHYKQSKESTAPWAARHQDIGLLTILVNAIGKGLKVHLHDGSVLEPELSNGEAVAQIGDTLEAECKWMKDEIPMIATPHEVLNNKATGIADAEGNPERFSMPFFTHPFGNMPVGDNFTANQFLAQRLTEIGVTK